MYVADNICKLRGDDTHVTILGLETPDFAISVKTQSRGFDVDKTVCARVITRDTV